MANQHLTEILNQLSEHLAIVNQDISGWDPRTLSGKVLQKRQAEDEVASLTKAYKNLVGNHVMKVFLKGPRAAAFAEFAAKNGQIVADGSELYTILAKEVDATMDRNLRVFGAHQTIQLVRTMASYGQDAGYRSLPMPKYEANDLDHKCPEFVDTVAKVRQGVRASSGDDLNKLHLEKSVIDTCLKTKAAGNVIPVILTNLSDAEVEGLTKTLFPGSTVLTVDATEESNDKDLVDLINNKMKAVFEELKKKEAAPTLNW